MLVRISQSSFPLLLKEEHSMARCPEASPVQAEFAEALGMYERGTWIAARDRFQRIAQHTPPEPAAVKNIATLESLLGNNVAAIVAYRRYAELNGIALDDAVEAEALAQLLDPATDRHKIDVLKIIYAVTDLDRMLERLQSDRRVIVVPAHGTSAEEAGAPPPRARCALLDRPLPPTGRDMQRDQVPQVIGEFLFFGKETDRDARLELTLTRNQDFDKKLTSFLEVAGEFLGPAQHEQVVGRVSAAAETLTTRWQMPADTDPQHAQALVAEESREAVLHRWPQRPLSVLDDKTPAEAAQDPAYCIRLLAAILLLELMADQRRWESVDFNQLRASLGLPLSQPIEPDTVDVARVPLARLTRLQTEKLSDGDLVAAYNRAVVKRVAGAIDQFGLELIRRNGSAGLVDKADVYAMLALNAKTTDRALDLLANAIEVARQTGRSPAPYLISELNIQLREGHTEQAQNLLQTIQSRHINEPGIREMLVRTLAKHGLIRPDGLPASPQRPAPRGRTKPAPEPGASGHPPASHRPSRPPSGPPMRRRSGCLAWIEPAGRNASEPTRLLVHAASDSAGRARPRTGRAQSAGRLCRRATRSIP